MTFVVDGDARALDHVRKQLEKIMTVVEVDDFSGYDYADRDLMLMKPFDILEMVRTSPVAMLRSDAIAVDKRPARCPGCEVSRELAAVLVIGRFWRKENSLRPAAAPTTPA